MAKKRFTLIDDGREVCFDAEIAADSVSIPTETLPSALGWELKPEGLCRDGLCVPVGARAEIGASGVDLASFAKLIDRPLALDIEESAAVLGVSAQERSEHMASLEAPDFNLPDLEGKLHSVSEHRGKKVLLVAYASW